MLTKGGNSFGVGKLWSGDVSMNFKRHNDKRQETPRFTSLWKPLRAVLRGLCSTVGCPCKTHFLSLFDNFRLPAWTDTHLSTGSGQVPHAVKRHVPREPAPDTEKQSQQPGLLTTQDSETIPYAGPLYCQVCSCSQVP
jgi:hypothetical protein